MKYALLSVYDKTGIVELANHLVANGYTILSSGGTYEKLEESGIGLHKIRIEDYTGFPEIMGGRVKTLHPKIHGGILGDRHEHDIRGIEWIDIVVVNLYPFKTTIENLSSTVSEAIEQIDIGGTSLLRAAAKNFMYVTAVCDLDDYDDLICELPEPSLAFRKKMALKVFKNTSQYDLEIANWFAGDRVRN